jgi:hypothetical protein
MPVLSLYGSISTNLIKPAVIDIAGDAYLGGFAPSRLSLYENGSEEYGWLRKRFFTGERPWYGD